MAIHAINFNGVARFSVEFSIAVTVLFEMAVNTMHSLFQMDVLQVDSLFELVRIIERNLVVLSIQKISFAIVLESLPENPSVAMEVFELSVLEVFVEFRRPRLLEEVHVGPVAANRSPLRIPLLDRLLLLRTGMALFFGIHLVAIGLVIPPDVAVIRRDHVGAGMDVANDALTRRNGSSELMFEGMSGLILGDGRVDSCGLTKVAAGRIMSRMFRRTIIGVDHVASVASAGAIVSGLIVGSRKREQRIEQARFL